MVEPVYWVARLKVPEAEVPAVWLEGLITVRDIHSPAGTEKGESVVDPPVKAKFPPMIWMDCTCKAAFPLLHTQQVLGLGLPTGTMPQFIEVSLKTTDRRLGVCEGGKTVVIRSKNWG